MIILKNIKNDQDYYFYIYFFECRDGDVYFITFIFLFLDLL